MSVAFYGTSEVVLSFEAGAVTEGYPVVLRKNDQVSDAGEGEAPVGLCLHVREGLAAVQMKGYVELPFSGPAPNLGWAKLVADGMGGVKADAGGHSFVVIRVEPATSTVGLYL